MISWPARCVGTLGAHEFDTGKEILPVADIKVFQLYDIAYEEYDTHSVYLQVCITKTKPYMKDSETFLRLIQAIDKAELTDVRAAEYEIVLPAYMCDTKVIKNNLYTSRFDVRDRYTVNVCYRFDHPTVSLYIIDRSKKKLIMIDQDDARDDDWAPLDPYDAIHRYVHYERRHGRDKETKDCRAFYAFFDESEEGKFPFFKTYVESSHERARMRRDDLLDQDGFDAILFLDPDSWDNLSNPLEAPEEDYDYDDWDI